MEIILELIFEFIVEGSLGAIGHKKVPMALRIIAAAFLITVFGGLIALFIILGIRDQSWACYVFAGVLALIVAIAVITIAKKHRK